MHPYLGCERYKKMSTLHVLASYMMYVMLSNSCGYAGLTPGLQICNTLLVSMQTCLTLYSICGLPNLHACSHIKHRNATVAFPGSVHP